MVREERCALDRAGTCRDSLWVGKPLSLRTLLIILILSAFMATSLNVSQLGTTTYLMDVYHALNGASAMAANGLLRYIFGAAFPLFTIQMYQKLGIPWAGSLLGFISLGLLPVPWVLFKWGDIIRSRSSYPTGSGRT